MVPPRPAGLNNVTVLFVMMYPTPSTVNDERVESSSCCVMSVVCVDDAHLIFFDFVHFDVLPLLCAAKSFQQRLDFQGTKKMTGCLKSSQMMLC